MEKRNNDFDFDFKPIGQGTLTAIKNGTGGLDSKTIARLAI